MRIEKLRIAMEEDPSERNVARYSRAQDEFASSGGYGAESEARSIAPGLGLPDDRIDLPIGVLSGGERRRVELSRILFAGSEALLLDEPTNHLDVDAKTWLLDFMRTYRGAMLVISHDLELLDEAITRVIHLDRPQEDSVGQLVEYKGTYTQYRNARARDEERVARQALLQDKEIARLQGIVDRFGAKATKAAMAHSKEKQIARLEAQRVQVGPADRTLRVRFPDPPSAGVTVLTTDGLSKAYGGPPVFEDVSFDLGRGERLHRPRPQRRRQDQPAAHPRRRDRRQPRAVLLRPQRQRRLLRPGARQPAWATPRCSTTCAPRCRPAWCSPRRSCAACSG